MFFKQRIMLVMSIMILVTTTITGTAMWWLYLTAIEEQEKRLYEVVQTQARLMEAVATYDKESLGDNKGRQATLSQIEQALSALDAHLLHSTYAGRAFELIIAEQQGEQIVFLYKHGHLTRSLPAPIALSSKLAEPMRRALLGHSGTIIGLDYRNEQVLAAYEPVECLKLAVVAKIDMSAIRMPFINIAITIILLAIGLIFLGVLLVWYLLAPLIKALHWQETRFHALFEHMNSGVAIYQPTADGKDFIFVDLNQTGQRISQINKEDILGKCVTEIFPSIREMGLFGVLQRVNRSGEPETHPVSLYQDQRLTRWVENRVYCLPHGELVAVYDDVTARKQAEEQLRDSEARFRLLVNNMPVLMAYVDEEQRYRLANQKYWEWLDIDPDQVIGKTIRDVVGEALYATLEPHIAKVLTGQVATFTLTAAMPKAQLEVVAHYLPHINENGVVEGFFIMVEDVSARKKLEQERDAALNQLQQYAGDLEKRVAERTQALAETNLTLQKLSKMKDEFLAGISHELRSPLTTILISSETLQEGVYGELVPKQQKMIQHINDSANHLLSLINDILDVAKIEAGKMTVELSPVSPLEMCQSCFNLSKEIAQKKGVKLHYQCDSDVAAITADNRRLKQILLNLLSNAIKFTPKGGEVGLEFNADKENQQVSFSVWDTGIGIAEEMTQNLFQPFVQIDSSLSRQFPGTGLGLALVRRLTEIHGGSVHLETQEGEGSRFTVTLPWRAMVTPTTVPYDETETQHNVITGTGNSILIVDDSQDTQELLTGYLQHHGFQVFNAIDGSEAIRIAHEQQPQLVLMDIQMPGMDGFEVTRHFRQRSTLQTIPIIALTALAMPGDSNRCLEVGANAYLSKPIKLRELLSTIESILLN